MANLSNINNKFLVTTGGNVLIGQTSAVGSSILQITGTSIFKGIANVIELNQSSTGSATYYVMDNTVETGGKRYRFGYSGGSADKGSFTIYNETDGILPLTLSGANATFAGDVTLDNVVFTPAVLPAINTPSINLRNTNNEFYFQAGSGGIFNFMKADYTSMLTIESGTSTFASNLASTKSQNTATSITVSNTNTGSLSQARFVAVSDSGNIQLKAVSAANTTYGAGDSGVINCDTMSGGLRFAHNDVVKMTIDTSGRVGIGTTSPNGKLQFENSANTRKIVLYEGANNDYEFYGFGVESQKLIYSVYTNTDDHVFVSGVNSTSRNELMRIEGGGNVGIGTDSPGAKLTIGDPGGATTRSIQIEGNNSTSGMNGVIGYFANALYLTNNYYYNSAQVHPVSTFGQTSIACIASSTTGGNFIDFAVSDHTDANNAPDSRMRIMDSGNVGIGTTLPDTTFHVKGISSLEETTAGAGTQLRLIGQDSSGQFNFLIGKQFNVNNTFEITPSTAANGTTFSNPAFVIKSDGNVGIGYTNPSQAFVVKDGMVVTGANSIAADTSGGYICALGANSGPKSLHTKGYITADGGIRLGGSASANQLDDYEEGTWTPAINGSTAAGSTTYTGRGGTYTKIGNQVTAWFTMTSFSITGASGFAILAGLPFTASFVPASGQTVRGAFSSNLRFYQMNFPTGGIVPTLNLANGSTTASILWSRSGTSWVQQDIQNQTGQYFEGYITYTTA